MINAPVRVSLIQLSVPAAGCSTPLTVTAHAVLARRSSCETLPGGSLPTDLCMRRITSLRRPSNSQSREREPGGPPPWNSTSGHDRRGMTGAMSATALLAVAVICNTFELGEQRGFAVEHVAVRPLQVAFHGRVAGGHIAEKQAAEEFTCRVLEAHLEALVDAFLGRWILRQSGRCPGQRDGDGGSGVGLQHGSFPPAGMLALSPARGHRPAAGATPRAESGSHHSVHSKRPPIVLPVNRRAACLDSPLRRPNAPGMCISSLTRGKPDEFH